LDFGGFGHEKVLGDKGYSTGFGFRVWSLGLTGELLHHGHPVWSRVYRLVLRALAARRVPSVHQHDVPARRRRAATGRAQQCALDNGVRGIASCLASHQRERGVEESAGRGKRYHRSYQAPSSLHARATALSCDWK